MTRMSEFESDTYIKEGFALQNLPSFPQHKHSHAIRFFFWCLLHSLLVKSPSVEPMSLRNNSNLSSTSNLNNYTEVSLYRVTHTYLNQPIISPSPVLRLCPIHIRRLRANKNNQHLLPYPRLPPPLSPSPQTRPLVPPLLPRRRFHRLLFPLLLNSNISLLLRASFPLSKTLLPPWTLTAGWTLRLSPSTPGMPNITPRLVPDLSNA